MFLTRMNFNLERKKEQKVEVGKEGIEVWTKSSGSTSFLLVYYTLAGITQLLWNAWFCEIFEVDADYGMKIPW